MSGYYSEVAALSGLVAFLKLDESGASATDSSGNGNTGTYTGSPSQQQTSIIPGEPTSACVTFNGSSQYVSINDAAGFSLPTTNALTIGAWVKPTATAAGSHTVWGKGNSSGTQWEWELSRTNAPAYSAIIYNSGGTPRQNSSGPAGESKADDVLHFIVVTMDDTGGDSLIFYINATAGTPQTGFSSTSIDGTSVINIGRRPDVGRYFSGSVQGWFVTSTVLSAGTVSSLYTAGITPPATRSGIRSLNTMRTMRSLR